MQLTLHRIFLGKATMGRLYINGDFFAYTLEDQCRGLMGDCTKKVPGNTCIDPGNYEIILSYSNRFKKYLPLLLNVPCFEGIRIHGGNSIADTEGCIIVAANSNHKDRVWNCSGIMNSLMAKLKAVEKREKVFISISQPPVAQ